MSIIAIRAALETHLAGLSPALATAWEDDGFDPVPGQPYQAVHVLWAMPENNETGRLYRQGGILQVSLRWPADADPLELNQRAELVRDSFPRGLTLTSAGVKTNIETTPAIAAGPSEPDRIVRIVRVTFYSNDLI